MERAALRNRTSGNPGRTATEARGPIEHLGGVPEFGRKRRQVAIVEPSGEWREPFALAVHCAKIRDVTKGHAGQHRDAGREAIATRPEFGLKNALHAQLAKSAFAAAIRAPSVRPRCATTSAA